MHDTTAFHDLAAFTALPRVSSLALSPDGTRLVTAVQDLAADGTRYIGALWEVDPAGVRPARRLTRSGSGESAPRFLPDGTLLFLSARPDTDPGEGEEDRKEAALWSLPASGGEAAPLLARPGGIHAYAVATGTDRIALVASLLPGAEDTAQDAALRKAREKAKVTAILHESSMIRHWDNDLGPDIPHLFTVAGAGTEPSAPIDCGAGSTLGISGAALSPDGSLAAYTVLTGTRPDELRYAVVVSDAATGKQLRTVEAPDAEFSSPAFTPDGRHLVCVRAQRITWEQSGDQTLWLVDATDGQDTGRDLLPGFDQWPGDPVVSPLPSGDGSPVVFFTAAEGGREPVFRVSAGSGDVVRLTASGAYTDVVAAPDGATLYALRSAVDSAPAPVRLDAATPDQQPEPLPCPGAVGELPGTLTEVFTSAEDGTPLRAWLVLPREASAEAPAPLLLWVHGGPQSSWNSWTWRWNPWVAAAAGYAVLLPDPALSTGYGQRMHQRGWGDWGGAPYRDVLALTDAALDRDDLDADRTAMMGGSFGGYMANWIATQTDRFRAIVTHASLWNLPAFAATTDFAPYWMRHHGDPLERTERYQRYSPHLRVASITTPMLVVHGDKDYRVPIGEALSLWSDLTRFEVPAKFLYFPDEGHWVVKPNNSRLWYATVLSFLAHHVLGEEWRRPELV
ncbi:S9 family peptidase [Peterkaempfera bronchialis]|uniref:S9 family peptidase n=1 Tax=Peterkaempfera bronchialis TaxID=2126346 RepID=A0A345T5B6_9ACTN|nr:S9 family peptidase [Peterkaempfera bronchialis]AXI81171.1 S9 family peptidase [Peterkaempfera bronchialis]